MDFYLNLLNDKERGPDDQPSIGVILCAEKDDIEVEYALRNKANPIGVATYELRSKLPGDLKGKLPTQQQLAGIVRRELEEGKWGASPKSASQRTVGFQPAWLAKAGKMAAPLFALIGDAPAAFHRQSVVDIFPVTVKD